MAAALFLMIVGAMDVWLPFASIIYGSGAGVHFSEAGISGNARAFIALTEQAAGSVGCAATTGVVTTGAFAAITVCMKLGSKTVATKKAAFLSSMDKVFINNSFLRVSNWTVALRPFRFLKPERSTR